MNQRIAVSIGFLVAGCAGQSGMSSMGPTPRGGRELSPQEQASHAVSRLTFGARTGDAARVERVGVDRWIAEQLEPQKIDDSAADRLLSAFETQQKRAFELVADHVSPEELQRRWQARGGTPTPADSASYRRAQTTVNQLTAQIPSARMLRAVVSERQLQEVMTDFWENHFSVFVGKSPTRYSMVEYDRDVIRPRALSKFRDLLGAVAKSTQMLYYLDNVQSAVDSMHPTVAEARIEVRRRARYEPGDDSTLISVPKRRGGGLNENYARELMELHTLGVDGGYTQQDVVNVARALTGWTIDRPELGGAFYFRRDIHDAGEKVVLGQRLPAGRGIEDGEQVLDIVARHPATARFIATKLVRHFVSDSAPPALVERAAEAFRRTDGDVREVVRTIVTSPEFFSRAAYRAKVKTPFELVASALRAMNAVPDTTPRTAQWVARLGQPIFGRQTPDGWPDRGDAWMNTGAILNRINFGLAAAAGQVPGVRLDRWPAAERLRTATVHQQVDGVIGELFQGDVSPDTRAILASGQNPAGTPTAPNGTRPPQLTGLANIVGLALGAPEFQKR